MPPSVTKTNKLTYNQSRSVFFMDKKKAPGAKNKTVPPAKGKAVPPKGKGGASQGQMDARDKFKAMIAAKKEAAAKKKK